MKMIITYTVLAILLIPEMTMAHGQRGHNHYDKQEKHKWHDRCDKYDRWDRWDRYDRYDQCDRYDRSDEYYREKSHDRTRYRPKHRPKTRLKIQQGWDVSPQYARTASNCYRYSLTARGGQGSARIMSLPGKNYILVNDGQKNGYVCFNGSTTLEIGKLGNPGIRVKLDIDRVGTFFFGRGDTGAKYLNNWYRSYWGL